ncbi:MAG TPA: hypothetical protein VK541_20320 [Pedobacter sp.]|uniref:hypothetical protein n=1 Tax=Pedobacter sp. TaxID=1411316 RepID=UPI002C52BE23|nr:hypothetical protein [Pedobacter sp.]HMI04845.1 hypothetical protein [Pedobacter sp.]
MFRKIHSKRDPSHTLFSEIRKEFAVYFNRAWAYLSALLVKYPRQVFVLMVLLMLFSMALSFTVFRHSEKKVTPAEALGAQRNPVEAGISEIMEKTRALREIIAIKKQIEFLIGKGSLTPADSLHLEKAIDRLHQITINANKYDPR